MNPFKFKKKAVGIFLTADFPTKEKFIALLLELQDQEIDFIEIGIPYSDPIADGVVIQEASNFSISNGFTIKGLFDVLDQLSEKITKPLVLMGYGNQVLQFGVKHFLERSKKVGIKAFIFPDLPLEMLENKFPDLLDETAIPFVHLITPSTPKERVKLLAEASKNAFVYLVGSSQTTGGNYRLEEYLSLYAEMKALCGEVPVFLGFGIDSNEKIHLSHTVVDGAIIGSAYIQAAKSGKTKEFVNSIT